MSGTAQPRKPSAAADAVVGGSPGSTGVEDTPGHGGVGDEPDEVGNKKVWRRTAVAAAVGGFIAAVLLGASWSRSSPVGATPDEDLHLSSIWCVRPSEARCVPGRPAQNGRLTVRVPAAVAEEATTCFAFQPDVTAACQTSARDRDGLQAARANRVLYPGGYYAVLAPLVQGNVDRSVQAMRFASWSLNAMLVAASLACATVRVRRSAIIALTVTIVPLAMYLLASVNPSGPTFAGVFAFTACALTVFHPTASHRRQRVAAVVGVAGAVLALLARYDSALWVLVAFAAALVIADRPLRWGAATASLAAAAALSAFSLGRYVVSGTPTENWTAQAPGRSFWTVIFRNLTELPSIWLGNFGTWALGWFDTPVPAVVWTTMFACFVLVVADGLRRHRPRQLVGAGVVVATLVVVPLYVMRVDGSVVGEAVQPRYLLPLLPVLVMVTLCGSREKPRAWSTGVTWLMLGAVVVAHSVTLHAVLHRHVSGLDLDGFWLDGMVVWWWPSGPGPMMVWSTGSVSFAFLAWLGGRLLTATPVANVAVVGAAATSEPEPDSVR